MFDPCSVDAGTIYCAAQAFARWRELRCCAEICSPVDTCFLLPPGLVDITLTEMTQNITSTLQAASPPIVRLSLIFTRFHDLRPRTGNSILHIDLHSLVFKKYFLCFHLSCILAHFALFYHLLICLISRFLFFISAALIFWPPSFTLVCLYEDDSFH